jgi:hypothetical protein
VNNEFYRLPPESISQGDIFRDVPSAYVANSDLEVVRRRQSQRGPVGDLYTVGDEAHRPQQAFDPNGDEVVGRVQVAHALVLTHACEIDNSPKATIIVGLIRAMKFVPEDARAAIRDGRNRRLLYLPPNDEPLLEESYLDFSRLTSIRREALRDDHRILSLTQTTLKAVYLGLTRYLMRYELPEVEIDALVQKAIEDAARE